MMPPPSDIATGRTAFSPGKKKGANGRLGRAQFGEVLVQRVAFSRREGDGEGERRERAPNGKAAEAMRKGGSRKEERPILGRAGSFDNAAYGKLERSELLP